MARETLGHIDCPCCGTVKGMRITHDKNGEPFGYCEATCSGQLRIGGQPHRVAAFLKMHPWAAGKPAPAPVSAPVPVPKPTAEQANAIGQAMSKAKKPAPAPVPAPAPAKPRSANPFDFLLNPKAPA